MIDLQLHTTDSDGTWAWDAVLLQCKKLGLSAYAITDHDTIVRCDDIRKWAYEHNQMAIPGIELSTHEQGQTVHLLGYFLEGPLDHLKSRLDFLKQGRDYRNRKIISRLRQLGFDVTDEDLMKVAGSGTVGRPHIARLLLQKNYVQSIKEAFDRFLSVNGLAYYPKEELPLHEGIDLLHNAGCVTAVAHPLLLNRSSEQLQQSFLRWKEWGLDGLECIYPTYKPEQTSFILREAEKLGFLVTGGSDFHGDNKPHIDIGSGTGSLNVPDGLIGPLLEKKNELLKHK